MILLFLLLLQYFFIVTYFFYILPLFILHCLFCSLYVTYMLLYAKQ